MDHSSQTDLRKNIPCICPVKQDKDLQLSLLIIELPPQMSVVLVVELFSVVIYGNSTNNFDMNLLTVLRFGLFFL